MQTYKLEVGKKPKIEISSIGGDLRMRGIGRGTIETVGVDFHARRRTRDLTIDHVGGNASVERIYGDVHIKALSGDLALQRVDGSVQASPGGDASLAFSTVTGKKIIVQAGGDLLIKVGNVARYTAFSDLGNTIAAQVEFELEAEIAQMKIELGAFGDVFNSDRSMDEVRRAVTKARCRAERARRRAARQVRKHHKTIQLALENLSRDNGGIREEERLSILRMLGKGIITVVESEKLFLALEGEA